MKRKTTSYTSISSLLINSYNNFSFYYFFTSHFYTFLDTGCFLEYFSQ
jgi:hypothetical protein